MRLRPDLFRALRLAPHSINAFANEVLHMEKAKSSGVKPSDTLASKEAGMAFAMYFIKVIDFS